RAEKRLPIRNPSLNRLRQVEMRIRNRSGAYFLEPTSDCHMKIEGLRMYVDGGAVESQSLCVPAKGRGECFYEVAARKLRNLRSGIETGPKQRINGRVVRADPKDALDTLELTREGHNLVSANVLKRFGRIVLDIRIDGRRLEIKVGRIGKKL